MDAIRQALRGMPVPVRYAAAGAVLLGLPGAAVGLVLGLRTYLPTAWAATVEVGLPAAVLGAVVGAAIGSVLHLTRGRAHRTAP